MLKHAMEIKHRYLYSENIPVKILRDQNVFQDLVSFFWLH